MREPRVVRLGTVRVRDGEVHVEAEPGIDVTARPGEEVLLALHYDYREGGADRERLRLVLRATLGGEESVAGEAGVDDVPGLLDARRGYFSVPVRAPAAGLAEGVAEVRGAYSTRPWSGRGDAVELPVRASIPLRVRVG